jgi:hypothetical protein
VDDAGLRRDERGEGEQGAGERYNARAASSKTWKSGTSSFA